MMLQVLRRWWPLAAIAVLLGAAALAAAHSTPQLDRLPSAESSQEAPPRLDEPAAEPTALVGEQPVADEVELPGWLPAVVDALCLLVVVGLAGLLAVALIRGGRRQRTGDRLTAGGRPGGRPSDEEVIAALDAGLSDLSDDDGDPRRAVIACWLRLEDAAAAAGMPRHVGDTSTDLVVRLLGSAREGGRAVSGPVLAGFAEVYRAARYGTGPVDEAMRRQAREALHRLRAELTGAGAAP